MSVSWIAAALLAVAVTAFLLVVMVRERRLDRALDRVAAGTEERYDALVARRASLRPPSPPVILLADEVLADLPWNREPVDLDAVLEQGRRARLDVQAGRWSA